MNTTIKVDVHKSPSVLQSVKEDLISVDLVSQLEIADGLKELLISKNFTIQLLLDTPVPELAKILGIDNYIAKLIRDAAMKIVKPEF
jgi:hypothetical protein